MVRMQALSASTWKERAALLLAACALALVGLLTFGVQPAHASYDRDWLRIGGADGRYTDVFVDATGAYADMTGGDARTLPEGITWDSATYTLTLNNWTGAYIVNNGWNTSAPALNINLVGTNKLTGGFDRPKYNYFCAIDSEMPIVVGGSGTLVIDNTECYPTDRTSKLIGIIIHKTGSPNSGDTFTLKDSASLEMTWTAKDNAWALYLWSLVVDGAASAEVNAYSESEQGRVFGNGGLICNTSESVVLMADYQTWEGGFDWKMNGEGHLTAFQYGLSRKCSGGSGRSLNYESAYGYRVYGNSQRDYSSSITEPSWRAKNITPALSISGPARANTTVTKRSFPLEAPVAGEAPQYALMVFDDSGNREYVADVQWYEGSGSDKTECTSLVAFKENTVYSVVVSLAAMPGYTFQGLFSGDITVPGATSSSYDADNAVITATFPATGTLVKPQIATELDLAAPVAKSNAQTDITGEGFTGDVEWTRLPRGNVVDHFDYDSLYAATINLKVAGTHTVSGLTASDFTVKGLDPSLYTVDYTEGSTTVTVTFAEPTEFALSLKLGATDYFIDKDGVATPGLPDGLSFDLATKSLVLENYSGSSIVSTQDEGSLNLYLKGTNTLTGYSYNYDACDYTTPLLGLATYSGDLTIRGEKGASLNVDIVLDETNAAAVRYVVGIGAQRGNASRARFTLYDPDVNVSVRDESSKETGSYLACLFVDSRTGEGDIPNIVLDGAGSMNLYDDAGAYCVGSYCVLGHVDAGSNFTGSIVAVGKNNATAGWGSSSVTLPGTSSATHISSGYASGQKVFTYLPRDISNYDFALEDTSFPYTGSPITPAVVSSNEYVTEGSAYSVSYSDNVEPGTATATITGVGEFKGTVTKTFAIESTAITDDMVTLSSSNSPYTGEDTMPVVYVKTADGIDLVEDVDFECDFGSSDFVRAGTHTIIVRGIGSYSGEVTRTFTIIPQSLSDATVTLSPKAYAYSAKKRTPAVTVRNWSGTVLVKNVDYTVTYAAGRTKVGKYKVTITGKGNYKGSASAYFTIKPAKASVYSLSAGQAKLVVKASTAPSKKGATSYQIAYRVKGTSKWKYASTKYQSTTLKSLKRGKYYQVRIRAKKTVSGKAYYGAWSTVKTSKKIK